MKNGLEYVPAFTLLGLGIDASSGHGITTFHRYQWNGPAQFGDAIGLMRVEIVSNVPWTHPPGYGFFWLSANIVRKLRK